MAEILTDNWHLYPPPPSRPSSYCYYEQQTFWKKSFSFNELKAGKNVTRQFKCNKIPYCYHEQKTFSKKNFLFSFLYNKRPAKMLKQT